MIKLLFISVFLIISLDVQIKCLYKRLCVDFLIGNTSKREAKEILSSKKKTKFNVYYMHFVCEYLKYDEDKKVFRKFYVLYKIWFCSLLPLFLIFIISCFAPQKVFIITFCSIIIIKFVILSIYRLPSFPFHYSKYRKKKGNRK